MVNAPQCFVFRLDDSVEVSIPAVIRMERLYLFSVTGKDLRLGRLHGDIQDRPARILWRWQFLEPSEGCVHEIRPGPTFQASQRLNAFGDSPNVVFDLPPLVARNTSRFSAFREV